MYLIGLALIFSHPHPHSHAHLFPHHHLHPHLILTSSSSSPATLPSPHPRSYPHFHPHSHPPPHPPPHPHLHLNFTSALIFTLILIFNAMYRIELCHKNSQRFQECLARFHRGPTRTANLTKIIRESQKLRKFATLLKMSAAGGPTRIESYHEKPYVISVRGPIRTGEVVNIMILMRYQKFLKENCLRNNVYSWTQNTTKGENTYISGMFTS